MPTRMILSAAAMLITMAMTALPSSAHDPAQMAGSAMASGTRAESSLKGRTELAQSLRAMEPECYCWANGQRFAHGEQACIKAPGGTRLAICDRVTNVMSWSFSADPCPES